MEAGDYLCFIAKSADSIIAIPLLLSLPQAGLSFLEYLAVDQAQQSLCLGSGLLRFVIEQIDTPVICEVEPPFNDDPADICNRRLRFYERLGARIIDNSSVYAMPNFERREGGVPLLLMQWPLTKQPEKGELRLIVCEIYDSAYSGWDKLREEISAALEKSPNT